jgi:Phage gp6-like head-tail connector protein
MHAASYASQIVSPPMAEPLSLDEIKRHLKVEHDAEDALIQSYLAAARAHAESYLNRALVVRTVEVYFETWQGVFCRRLPFAPLRAVESVKYIDSAGIEQTLDPAVYLVGRYSGTVSLAANQSWPSLHHNRPFPVVFRILAGSLLPVTADEATDLLTGRGGGLSDGDRVRLSNSGGALPAPLAGDTDYFVVDSSGNDFKLSATSGGAAIDVTDNGSGIHYAGLLDDAIKAAIKLIAGELYKQRENSAAAAAAEIPLSAQRLLWPHRILNV